MARAVLVSDFDGTITKNDFYKLVAAHLLSEDALTPWQDYLAGRRTHFEALRIIFGRIKAPIGKLEELARMMEPAPGLAQAVSRLRAAGWEIVGASAGCSWYIERVLAQAGVTMTVYANPGEYPEGGPLVMRAPSDSPFFTPETGVDKAAIVRFHQKEVTTVAFAGDGFADLPAALAVPADLRFARADLAQALTEKGEAFRPFDVWTKIADALLSGEDAA